MTTYNNIINSFRNFAYRHKMINTFYSGQEWDFQADTNIYPAIVMSPDSSLIEDGRFYYKFNIFILDILKPDLSNQDEILSDASQIAGDIVAEFIENEDIYGFTIEESSQLTPLEEVIDDNVSGWLLSINIQSPFNSSNCLLPADSIYINYTGSPQSNYYTKIECDTKFLSATTFYNIISNFYNKQEIDFMLTGITTDNFFTTGATLNGSVAIFNRNDGINYNLDLSPLSATPITSLTFSAITNTPTTLSGYGINDAYNKFEVDSIITGITVDMSNYYTTGQTYTKQECDNKFLTGLTFDIGDYYNKTEVNDLLTGITIDMSNYYTTAQTYNKTEVNDLISLNEINITLLSGSSWSTGLTQSVYVSGVTTTNEIYWNASTLTDNILSGQANLFCSVQSTNSLTFICSTIPSSNISLKINIR